MLIAFKRAKAQHKVPRVAAAVAAATAVLAGSQQHWTIASIASIQARRALVSVANNRQQAAACSLGFVVVVVVAGHLSLCFKLSRCGQHTQHKVC